MGNNDSEPFFSIITPVYNCEKYLKECINSVINQTFSSWELILVDDGSTDSSGEICDSFCTDQRIKVIHQKNAGALKSRLNGIAAANGVYEIGLDSDDLFDENALEIVKRAIDSSQCDLIWFGIRFFNEQEGSYRCSLAPEKKYPKKEILKNLFEDMNPSLSNKAIKMSKVKQAKYEGLKEISIDLDLAQIVPILCNIDTGYVIKDILYNYRIYSKSLSHSCKPQHIQDIGMIMEFTIDRVKQAGLLDENMCKTIYLAYLKIVSNRLMELNINGTITQKDYNKIQKANVYKKSKEHEKMEYLRLRELIILKALRCKQYWLLKFFAVIQRKRLK